MRSLPGSYIGRTEARAGRARGDAVSPHAALISGSGLRRMSAFVVVGSVVDVVVVGFEVDEQLIDLVENFFSTSISTVNLVDDNNGRKVER